MKVHNLTICEQVRQEVTGKFILLGVYSNGILVNNFPANFPLTVWCLLESERIGTSDFAFRLRMPAIDVTLIEMDGGMDAVDLKSWTPIAFGGQVQVPSEGEIIVESKDDSGDWTTLRILHISKADLPLPPVGN